MTKIRAAFFIFFILFTLSVFGCDSEISAGTMSWRKFDNNIIDGDSWCPIASSFDGSILIVALNDGGIYASNDYGYNWKNITTDLGYKYWNSVSCSSDGKLIVAVAGRITPTQGSEGDYVYISNDFGGTWTPQIDLGKGCWTCVDSSSDGSILYAGLHDIDPIYYTQRTGVIFKSLDFGLSWKAVLGGKQWNAIKCSADGDQYYAIGYDYTYKMICGFIPLSDISNDWIFGKVGNNKSIGHSWSSIDCSDDGKIIYASDSNGYLYKSDDYGKTWKIMWNAGRNQWASVSCSADGLKLVAAIGKEFSQDCADYLYTSSDGGSSWCTQSGLGEKNWYFASYSGNGRFIYALTRSEFYILE